MTTRQMKEVGRGLAHSSLPVNYSNLAPSFYIGTGTLKRH